ncbi:MAG: EamA family transporter RarD [Synergistaceae bacterium]|nr:EamA family transporter RarD [Synergistaceae bacterium]
MSILFTGMSDLGEQGCGILSKSRETGENSGFAFPVYGEMNEEIKAKIKTEIKTGEKFLSESTKGTLAVLLTYAMWGVMPLYWKTLSSVPPAEILAHRAIWGCVFSLFLLALLRGGKGIASLFRENRGSLGLLVCSGAVLTVNWYLYIWAVNSGRILEASLGYFVNPLLSILFGVAVFRERLRFLQTAAVGFAACGVAVELAAFGRLPLTALGIALTFGVYGLLKKLIKADSLSGLTLETLFIVPFALFWLVWRQCTGDAHFPYGAGLSALLIGAGALTAAPLIVFAWGVRHTTMTAVGLTQYASPILTFLTATLIYHEPMPPARWLSFALIWAGIAVFTTESLLRART